MAKAKTVRLIICCIIIIAIILSIPATAFAAVGEPLSAELPACARAVILGNTETGEILWGQNEDEPLPPASTAKIMTALLVIEAAESGRISLNSPVTVTEEMISSIPSDASTMSTPIEDGEILTVSDLLYATMVVSDCLASNALAFYISGSIEAFARLMTDRAAELGCRDTVFTNPSGYPDSSMKSTARSLYLILCEAIKHDFFKTVSSAAEHTIPATNLNDSRKIKNYNYLLVQAASEKEESAYYYPYAISSKTGFSTPSGPCLASAAEKDGVCLAAVVLGGEIVKDESGKMIYNRYIDTVRMFEYGFAVLSARDIRAAIVAEKRPIVQNSRAAAESRRSAALSENEEIIKEFEKTREAELANRREFTKYVSLGCICAMLLLAAALILHRFSHFPAPRR